MNWPTAVRINAWTGDGPAAGRISSGAVTWALRDKPRQVRQALAPPGPANWADWRDPRVGWGLILPDHPELSDADRASAADAPGPIRRLLASRPDAPVLRYIPNSPYSLTHLRDYAAKKDPMIGQPPFGIASGAIPRYLLIYGSPEEIPWALQYVLNSTYYVGRLHLTDQALERYVDALISRWSGSTSRMDHPIAWSTYHGAGDITALMRSLIAAAVHRAWEADCDLASKACFIDGLHTNASVPALIHALTATKPALVVTTSHGQTGPLDDAATMAMNLGLPVDQDGQILRPGELLAGWEPDGAIWYAHACCSAGSDAATSYDGLVESGSPLDRVLKGIAGLGARIAPLPSALLGARKPLRAFIGHVEPTFDWTLQQPETGQPLTTNLTGALYNEMYRAQPVGLAFHQCYAPLSALRAQYDRNYDQRNKGLDDAAATRSLLYCRLVARDLEGMVILGDPIVALPPLQNSPD